MANAQASAVSAQAERQALAAGFFVDCGNEMLLHDGIF